MISKRELETIKEAMSDQAFFTEMCVEKRRSGRSVACAMWMISYAILREGAWINIRDHYGTKNADRLLFHMIQDILNKCEFIKHWSFNQNQCMIRFNPVYEVDPITLTKPEFKL